MVNSDTEFLREAVRYTVQISGHVFVYSDKCVTYVRTYNCLIKTIKLSSQYSSQTTELGSGFLICSIVTFLSEIQN